MLNFYRGPSKNTDNIASVPSMATFSCGIESRSSSVRIPFYVQARAGGYYEDRRPTSDMDPYLATSVLVCATLGINFPFSVKLFPAPSPQHAPLYMQQHHWGLCGTTLEDGVVAGNSVGVRMGCSAVGTDFSEAMKRTGVMYVAARFRMR